MKKSLFFAAAASALMLTACSSESDVVQNTTQQPQATVQQQAVGFDTYLAGTTAPTRNGTTGVMTTSTLQTTGFGVFASLSNDADYSSTTGPNFMYNQEVTYASPGWAYTPLKYWPNETQADMYNATGHATSTATDKLSFFAYAPYVSSASGATGITALSANTVPSTTDPTVNWACSTDPDQNVDLLWGVAPAGFSYTNVSGSTTSVPVGMPLLNLVKPDKDQKMKFLFQHALSRISLSVVSAIDQIAAGDDAGTFTNDPTTKVLIKSVSLTGAFGKSGTLNLKNGVANVANWTATTADGGATPLFTITGDPADLTPAISGNYFLAPDLRYVQSQITAVSDPAKFADVNTGVLPSEQALLAGDADPDPTKHTTTKPTYVYGKVYYVKAGASDKGYVIAKATTPAATKVYSKDDAGNFTLVSTGNFSVDGTAQYYTLTGDDAVVASDLVAPTGTDPAKPYWTKNATTGVFEKHELAVGGANVAANTYYILTDNPVTATYADATDWWSGLIPRYFMVIPTGPTAITVNIKYAVVTKDTKLSGNVSNVENDITKQVTVDLKNGKSYNLKLILGLTSVKLDATVADWKVDGSTEVDLPQNAE